MRHHGLSHHSLTAYGRVALSPALLAVPDERGPFWDRVREQATPLTARHTLREIILRDMKVEKAPDNIKVAVGETVPQGVHLKPIPADVTRKVPQIKNNTFFVKGDEIVIVEPKDNTVADIVK